MAKKKPTPETISQRFARLLLAEGARQGLSQSELARRAGVPRTTILRLAKGERTTTLETAQQLSQAVGVDFWTLLSRSE